MPPLQRTRWAAGWKVGTAIIENHPIKIIDWLLVPTEQEEGVGCISLFRYTNRYGRSPQRKLRFRNEFSHSSTTDLIFHWRTSCIVYWFEFRSHNLKQRFIVHGLVEISTRLSANNPRGNNKFCPLDFMIISIIEGGWGPFAVSEKEEGIGDQRETSHPSSVGALQRPSLQNYDGRPIFQIRYKFGRGVRKRGAPLNLCGKNRKINLGRPARTSVCVDRMVGGKECLSVCGLSLSDLHNL